MRKYLKKYANGIYYISEGYNENQMIASGFSNIKWVDSYIVYAACEKQDIGKLEGYIIVKTPAELIGKGGGLWSRYTSSRIGSVTD